MSRHCGIVVLMTTAAAGVEVLVAAAEDGCGCPVAEVAAITTMRRRYDDNKRKENRSDVVCSHKRLTAYQKEDQRTNKLT